MKVMSVVLVCLAGVAYAATAGSAGREQNAHVDAGAVRAAEDASSKLDGMSVDHLLAAARVAYAQHRLVAPDGDNAFAYYEAVLRKDPANRIARDALRDAFPFGVGAVERTIRRGNFDEARKEIDLLAKADPGNYSIDILRSRLPGRHELDLTAAVDSWINVTDAGGKVVYSGILRAGEHRSIRSSGPLDVVVGNALAVKVTADGKPLTLHPGYQSKVARFRVFAPPPASGH